MSAEPVPLVPSWPMDPLTAAEYAAMPEEPYLRYELQEGVLIVPSRPIPDHQDRLGELYAQVRGQVPGHLKVLIEVEIDLELVPPDQPGTVRTPDLVVVTREAFLRVRHEGGLLRAPEVVLAVEVHSTSSRRTDSVIKRAEYADAGIGHYWLIDLTTGPTLTACHHARDLGYADAGSVRGAFTVDTPFPVRIDLDALLDQFLD